MEKKSFFVSMAVLLVSAVPLFCSEWAIAATAENEVVISSPAIIETFDPAQYTAAGTQKGLNLLFNGLISHDGESASIVPELAESWKTSASGMEIIFKLRKGVKFHDGTSFNAAAVKFNWDRFYQVDAGGKYKSFADLNSVEVLDDYTVRFRLKEFSTIVLLELAGRQFGFNSPTYIKAHVTADDPLAKKWMNNHECGTGPFELLEWEPDARYVFKRFPGYWGGSKFALTPKIDKLTYKIVKDPSAARMMLEKGDIDLAEKLPADVIDQLQKSSGIKIKVADKYKIAFIIMNSRKPPFDNVKVRQAISYAINYDELIQYAEKGRAKRISGTLMDGFPGYDRKLQYNFDLVKAKQLLKEAGYPDGFPATIISSTDRYAGFELESVMIQSYLKKIGINLSIQKMAWPVQMETMNKGNFEMALQTWSSHYPEPAEQTFQFFSEQTFGPRWNWSYWKNDQATQLCDVILMDPDAKKRLGATREVEKLGFDNAVYVYLFQMPHPIAMRENMAGVIVHPGSPDLQPSGAYKKK